MPDICNELKTYSMKHRKISFWIIIVIGIVGIISSVYLYLKGADFSTYFLSGFSGLAIIITMLIDRNKKGKSPS